jgi:hypothetical protein
VGRDRIDDGEPRRRRRARRRGRGRGRRSGRGRRRRRPAEAPSKPRRGTRALAAALPRRQRTRTRRSLRRVAPRAPRRSGRSGTPRLGTPTAPAARRSADRRLTRTSTSRRSRSTSSPSSDAGATGWRWRRRAPAVVDPPISPPWTASASVAAVAAVAGAVLPRRSRRHQSLPGRQRAAAPSGPLATRGPRITAGQSASPPRARSSSEPWSDVPPELEALLRAQVAQKVAPGGPRERGRERAPRAGRDIRGARGSRAAAPADATGATRAPGRRRARGTADGVGAVRTWRTPLPRSADRSEAPAVRDIQGGSVTARLRDGGRRHGHGTERLNATPRRRRADGDAEASRHAADPESRCRVPSAGRGTEAAGPRGRRRPPKPPDPRLDGRRQDQGSADRARRGRGDDPWPGAAARHPACRPDGVGKTTLALDLAGRPPVRGRARGPPVPHRAGVPHGRARGTSRRPSSGPGRSRSPGGHRGSGGQVPRRARPHRGAGPHAGRGPRPPRDHRGRRADERGRPVRHAQDARGAAGRRRHRAVRATRRRGSCHRADRAARGSASASSGRATSRRSSPITTWRIHRWAPGSGAWPPGDRASALAYAGHPKRS